MLEPDSGAFAPTRRVVLGGAFGTLAATALTGPLAGPAHAAARSAPWALDVRMSSDAQWAAFLREQDLRWAKLPTVWHEGPFLGDGLLGSMIYKEPDANKIRFTTQHGRVQDHRPEFGSGFGTCTRRKGRPYRVQAVIVFSS